MSELNARFRARIGLPENEEISFDSLDRVLERTAFAIPFENLRIMERRTGEITMPNLMHQILVNGEGGVCYELNTILYGFLRDNGFDVALTRGVVYNYEAGCYSALGRTHVTILLNHGGQPYLVDTGFGGNLPLTPVPLTGEAATSRNGAFRIRSGDGEPGEHVLEVMLKHKHNEWKIGYAFDTGKLMTDLAECNDIQHTIAEHEQSAFNKNPLVTKLTPRGSITVTDSSLTRWVDGVMTKEPIDRDRFRLLLREEFGLGLQAPR